MELHLVKEGVFFSQAFFGQQERHQKTEGKFVAVLLVALKKRNDIITTSQKCNMTESSVSCAKNFLAKYFFNHETLRSKVVVFFRFFHV